MMLGATALVAFFSFQGALSAPRPDLVIEPPAPQGAPANEPQRPTAFENILRVNKDILTKGEDSGLVQGDIKIDDRVRQLMNRRARVKRGPTAYEDRLWPKNNIAKAVIPYSIDDSAVNITDEIMAGITHWAARVPCLSFQARSGQANYISFIRTDGGGCSSNVGRIGGRQNITLDEGCEDLSTVVHEIGHALGFWHEQSRPDRETYVTIHYDNLPEDAELRENFDLLSTDDIDSLNEPYDFLSVMHYSSHAFSINDNATITRKADGSEVLGNSDGLSTLDIRQAQKLYCNAPSCAFADFNANCPFWANQGYCKSDSIYRPFMRLFCSRSCANDDVFVVECPQWASAGWCTRQDYVGRVLRHYCQSSCRC